MNPIPVNTGGSALALTPKIIITMAIIASRIIRMFFMIQVFILLIYNMNEEGLFTNPHS